MKTTHYEYVILGMLGVTVNKETAVAIALGDQVKL